MNFKKLVTVLFMAASVYMVAFAEEIKNIIVVSSGENLSAAERAWLPASVKDELESNLQSYTKYSFVSSSESKIKELQKKSEAAGFDEKSAIELGKLTSAGHAIFVITRKTGNSYTVTAELTNLTTGKVVAKSVSSAKKKIDTVSAIDGSAVDEVTIDLCQKLGVSLTNTQKYLLQNGSLNVSGTDQMALYNQEVENYNKQISNFDAEIAKLMKSNSIDAITQKQKLESEKALAEEKRKAAEANKLRLAEIEKAKKEEAAAAAAGRTEEQRKKILEVSKSVNEKAAELRKLKTENLSALGKIKLVEAKKAALIEIRNNVKNEQKAISVNYKKEYDAKIAEVKNAPWRTAEKDEDGKPAKEAIRERENKVLSLERERDKVCLAAQKKIAQATYDNQVAVMADILIDEENMPQTSYYANNLNNNLRVKIGNYSRSNDGWKVNYTVLCDGVEIGSSEGFIEYSALEKFIPSGMGKFDAVDMYDSLFKCGEPVLTFEISYTVKEDPLEISTYTFSFSKLKCFDTNTVAVDAFGALKAKNNTTAGEKFTKIRKIRPGNDWGEKGYKERVIAKEREAIAKEREKILADLVKIPGINYKIGKTEVTQRLYKKVMGSNPSENKGDDKPVENVSWYDAIYFCNKLSEEFGYIPVYSVDGISDVRKWNYTPHKGKYIEGKIVQNTKTKGFRLPTVDEWQFAAKGGKNYAYSGSNNLDEVGWYNNNSGKKTHPVAQKKPNGYGLYDMSGNVHEWCWDSHDVYHRYKCGGEFISDEYYCRVFGRSYDNANSGYYNGFRIVCSAN